MRQFLVTSLAVLVLSSGLWACGSEDGESNGSNSTPGATAETTADDDGPEALTGEPTRVVAEVGADEISLGEVSLLVKAWRSGRNRDVDPTASLGNLQKQAVDNLIEQKLILQTATARGFAPAEAELIAALDQVKAQFPNEEALNNLLTQEGMTLDQFTKGFRADMTIRYFVEKAYLDSIVISDEEAKTFYEANPQDFTSPPQVSARHILIRTQPNGSPAADQLAKTRAEGVLTRAKAGEDFIELTKATSEDETTKDNGGDLGYFASGMMVPEFDRMVFSLEVGGISELVKTQFGYHIIKVEDKRPAGPMELTQVSPQIKDMLRHQQAGDRVTALVEKLKTEVEIKRSI